VLLVFLVFAAATLCLGHSLDMRRRLIHHSYVCPLWLEYFFVHLGVLVGMAGLKEAIIDLKKMEKILIKFGAR